MSAAHTKRIGNPWPFAKRKAVTGRTCARRSSATITEALKAAHKAGAHIGDTGAFSDWLCERGLQDRGKTLVHRLEREFTRGVEDGDSTPALRAYAPAPAPARPAARLPQPPTGQTYRHKGYQIKQTEGGDWYSSLDRDSFYDSYADVKHAIDEYGTGRGQRRNPLVEESPFYKSHRRASGFTRLATIDARKFANAYERQYGEPLEWKPDRSERIRGLDSVNAYPLVMFDGNRVGVFDGRHRIHVAAERGEPQTVAIRRGAVVPPQLLANPRKLRPRPLPPSDGPAPDTGNLIYIATDDGGLYWTEDYAGTSHVNFARKRGIPAERITGGGFINNGDMSDVSHRSDSMRYGERGRASMASGSYLNPGPRRTYTREELERLEPEQLDRMAWGFASGDTRTVPLSKLVPVPDDLDNAEYKAGRYPGGPKAWARTVDLSAPIEVRIKRGQWTIGDGHHRYYAAKLLGKKSIRAIVEIEDNSISKILGEHSNPLPPRSFDTMSEAIALSSPSGHMSGRARAAAQERASTALFGPGGLERPRALTPSDEQKREILLARAKEMRHFAARGFKPRVHLKEAERLEAEAESMRRTNPVLHPVHDATSTGLALYDYTLGLPSTVAHHVLGSKKHGGHMSNPSEFEAVPIALAELWKKSKPQELVEDTNTRFVTPKTVENTLRKYGLSVYQAEQGAFTVSGSYWQEVGPYNLHKVGQWWFIRKGESTASNPVQSYEFLWHDAGAGRTASETHGFATKAEAQAYARQLTREKGTPVEMDWSHGPMKRKPGHARGYRGGNETFGASNPAKRRYSVEPKPFSGGYYEAFWREGDDWKYSPAFRDPKHAMGWVEDRVIPNRWSGAKLVLPWKENRNKWGHYTVDVPVPKQSNPYVEEADMAELGELEPVTGAEAVELVESEVPVFQAGERGYEGIHPLITYPQMPEAVAYAQAVKGLHPGVCVVSMAGHKFCVVLDAEAVREAEAAEIAEAEELGVVEAVENPSNEQWQAAYYAGAHSAEQGPKPKDKHQRRVWAAQEFTNWYEYRKNALPWLRGLSAADMRSLEGAFARGYTEASGSRNPAGADDAEYVEGLRTRLAKLDRLMQHATTRMYAEYEGEYKQTKALLKFYEHNRRLPSGTDARSDAMSNPSTTRYLNTSAGVKASQDLTGPVLQLPKGSRVEVLERGKGGHRFLVQGDYYGERPVWGWVDKEYLDARPNMYSQNPAASVGIKDPRDMKPAEINREIEKLKQLSSDVSRDFIAAGRGSERPSEYLKLDDPLSNRARAIFDRQDALRREVQRHVGPGYYEFPSGFRASRGRRNPGDIPAPSGSSFVAGPEHNVRFKQSAKPRGGYRSSGSPWMYYPEITDVNQRLRELQETADLRRVTFYWEVGRKEAGGWSHYEHDKGTIKPRSKAEIKRRPNPLFAEADSAEAADALYSDFHGTPSSEYVEVITEIVEPDNLAVLGTLVSMVIGTVSGLEVTLGFESDPPYLASNPEGTQLYIQGGNQSLDLEGLKMSGEDWERPHMMIGDIIETTYRTEKRFDKMKTIDYYHANGEESGVCPQLVYDPVNSLLSIVGGRYKVLPEGIVD